MADNSSDLAVETFKLTKIYQNRQIALNAAPIKAALSDSGTEKG